MAEIAMRKVTKSFERVEVIRGVDLDIRDREFVVFVGPSGCGKSTLLRLVAGLEDVTSGDIFIDGARVNDALPSERGIAMVFQSYALYPHMTVFENMAFGLKLAKAGKHEVTRRVREAARVLQIDDLLARRPRELSGGQRQRVAIGRAITREPKVFLFDEPLSNLDAALRVQMRLEIARLKDQVAATMIYVTHDQTEAMTLADRIVVLNAGRVEQVGEPLELYRQPRSLFVAGFIGSPRMNFLPGAVEAVRPGEVVLRLKGGAIVTVPIARAASVQQGSEVTLGVRPEHVSTSAPSGGADGSCARVRGEVLVVEKLGAESFIYVRTDAGDTLVARGDPAERAAPGDQLELHLHARRCHLFGPDGVAMALSSSVDD